MNKTSIVTVAVLAGVVALSGCAHKKRANTLVEAQPKEFQPKGVKQAWQIAGAYDKKRKDVSITINGDPVLRGSFPPNLPKLTLTGKYQGKSIETRCDFASAVAGKHARYAYQAFNRSSGGGSGGDTCEVKVDQQEAATLYF